MLRWLSRKFSRKEATMATAKCSHVAEHLKKVKPQTKGCEECMKLGQKWLHLRMCLECGHVAAAILRRGVMRGRTLMKQGIR